MLPGTAETLIVGAGPTGLSVALALLARGREVTVVDKQAEGQNTSRASVVYSRTLEVLEPYGVAHRLASRGIHAPRFTIRDRDSVLMTVPFDHLPTAFPYTLLVSQAVTEAVLLQRLTELGGSVHRPYELTNLEQDEKQLTATFADGEQVHAQYLVGADGMHSTVREQAHIGFPLSGSGESYSLADVHLSRASDGLPRGEVAVYFSPDGQLVSVPFPDGSFKIVANVTQSPPEPDAAFVQQLLDARGPQAQRPVVQDVIWGSRFRIHHAVAERYNMGRIVLVGDAAHDNSPLGGQGMNTGIGDAVALAGALDEALASDSTRPLEAYGARRRRVARQVVLLTNSLTRLALMQRRLRTLRNFTLSTLNPLVNRRFAWQLSGLVYR
jgi:2-polyprenyl-6-methoxyphenol hydroxylase-like FAD-dependent oxidoreductase